MVNPEALIALTLSPVFVQSASLQLLSCVLLWSAVESTVVRIPETLIALTLAPSFRQSELLQLLV